MAHRLAVSLLCAVLLGSSIATAACADGSCPMAPARMDCCKHPPAGISAPGCCDRAPELSRNPLPPAAERPIQPRLAAPLAAVVPVIASTAPASVPQDGPRLRARAAPPGSTLIAQHTSLLL